MRPIDAKRAYASPLQVIGVFWPFALLAPFVPGFPLAHPSGPSCRQELVVALLLTASFALAFRTGKLAKKSAASNSPETFFIVSLAAFGLWGAASSMWAGEPLLAVQYSLTWASYFLFFYLVRRAVRIPRILRASLNSLTVVFLIISAASVIGGLGAPISLSREFGLGEPLAIAVPMFAWFTLTARKPWKALLSGAIALLAWTAVLQTLERAPFLGALFGLACLIALSIARSEFRPRSASRAVLLFAAFASVTVIQLAPPGYLRGSQSTSASTPSVLDRLKAASPSDPSTHARILYWSAALEMLKEHPLFGVGAANYGIAFTDARAQLINGGKNASLSEVDQDLIVGRAHNEYLQVLAELGCIGFLLLSLMLATLIWGAIRAIVSARNHIVPAAVSSLIVFAISSGASSISFRWMGSGLLFFFCSALLFGSGSGPEQVRATEADPFFKSNWRAGLATGFAALILLAMAAQAINSALHGAAQQSQNRAESEYLYQAALKWSPYDAATHYNFGVWLFYQNRLREAVPHLRFGTSHGFNATTCYAHLISAEAGLGDERAVSETLAYAIHVYPRSVYLRVRNASELLNAGRGQEAEDELQLAESIDPREAKGWWELMRSGVDAATLKARSDSQIAIPGELQPEACVFATLAENKHRAESRGIRK